jgi:hemoglobin
MMERTSTMNGKYLTHGIGLVAALLLAGGCGGGGPQRSTAFFTSGSREADQRADQRMAKAEQLSGEGEGAGEKKASLKQNAATVAVAPQKTTLFDRLGGQTGINAIIEDWIPRALADPRVNWERIGVTRGGFSIHRNKPVTWNATPDNVKKLKFHLAQFMALATGGPMQYDGKEMRQAHANLHIANDEFDAAVGDLKATLDRLQVPNKEQKELLSIVESTRPQVVEER